MAYNSKTRNHGFVPKSPEATRGGGEDDLESGPMGIERDSTLYPLNFKLQMPQDSRVFTYQAEYLVRGFEVEMAALYFSEHPRNVSRL